MKLLMLAAAFVAMANAKLLDESATIAGLTVHYKVVLPNDYDAAKTYPAVLAFPPGSQAMDMVQSTLVRNWSGEGQRRGYIVIVPAAPEGKILHGEGSRIFPEFLEKLLHDYKIRGNKFHLAGMSNGGVSAFWLASTYPQYFATLTGLPGYLRDATPERVAALSKMCIYMHAGELDTEWVRSMQQQATDFKAKGYSVHFTVEKGQGHVMSSLTGPGSARLYQEIEMPCNR